MVRSPSTRSIWGGCLRARRACQTSAQLDRFIRRFLVAAIGTGWLVGATASGALASPPVPGSGGSPGQWTSQATETADVGQSIASFALQFEGYRYVWAGNSPAGFDCSGFTQYVVLNTLGLDIGHGVAGQLNFGAWVDWGAWRPGDLVYFANTYRAGVSHAGIYIGDGLFIHAENESTGVVISSIYSAYYSGHYYSAVRLA